MPKSRPTSCSRTRGKKGRPHTYPDDPPRRRANKQRGHGTFATDRPPVLGVVGRATGLAQLWVAERVDSATLRAFVERTTRPDVLLYSDEWGGYAWVASSGRGARHGLPHAGPAGVGPRRR
jgi:hypothetical protein